MLVERRGTCDRNAMVLRWSPIEGNAFMQSTRRFLDLDLDLDRDSQIIHRLKVRFVGVGGGCRGTVGERVYQIVF